jgi:hypothetical protein
MSALAQLARDVLEVTSPSASFESRPQRTHLWQLREFFGPIVYDQLRTQCRQLYASGSPMGCISKRLGIEIGTVRQLIEQRS